MRIELIQVEAALGVGRQIVPRGSDVGGFDRDAPWQLPLKRDVPLLVPRRGAALAERRLNGADPTAVSRPSLEPGEAVNPAG